MAAALSFVSEHIPAWNTVQVALGEAVRAVVNTPTSAPALLVELILALSIVSGFRKGLTREIMGLIAWAVAGVAAIRYRHVFVVWAIPTMEPVELADGIGFGVIFFGGLAVGALVSSLFAHLIRISPLAGLDKLLGGMFGVLRGGTVIVTLYMASHWVTATNMVVAGQRGDGTTENSITTALSYIAPLMSRFVPSDLARDAGSGHDLGEPEDVPGEAYPENP
ncbi:CvpA family protein [Acetobacter sp.]|jgi:membrane protein required for colicin V production|uniref:CvpA family protein n=1 Tax=Acetobacter sp. TaxID=440 RepID=UPI0025C71EF6|nr:CvpA family protein [Acetobacter sp.]MCH4092592.1 CvpA family protein [Acetobacter sp.]MCI1299726.1 CvpA family protein [Acetobacter sp.]MCI1315394.1 CvpA family protein [Acetobacter sp.]